MMPGGPMEAYERVKPIFESIAAKVEGEPCVTYLGPGSAGHYVKMVHNGIEYALMQLIAETYDILKRIGQFSNDALAEVFDSWNEGPLKSFLIEITSQIFLVKDEETNQRLIDMIVDAARQKGTGKWTSENALELQVPIPTIDAAVSMRYMSAYKEEREEAARVFPPWDLQKANDEQQFLDDLNRALQFATIVSYAQGMSLLRAASTKYEYGLDLAEVARIWRGGCIIRSDILEDIMEVYLEKSNLENLMTEEPFVDILKENRTSLYKVIIEASKNGIPVPGLASALAYFDSYRTFRLPANLIQAQRDYFGSHTYERIDREGSFHTEW
jgi:6-phosphogluconate dehydrogenase